MAPKSHPSKSTGAPSRGGGGSAKPLDQAIKLATTYWYAVVLVVAAAWYMTSQGSADYTIIPIDDTQALKTVFFSGLPWLVYCAPSGSGSSLSPPSHLISTARAYPGASKQSITKPSDTLNIGLIDCESKLPSGKTVLERFTLTSLKSSIQASDRVAAFIVANGNRPAPVSEDFRSNKQAGAAMVKYALREVEPRVVSFAKSEYFAKQCANQKACAVVLSKGVLTQTQKDLIADSAKRFRYVNFATLDVEKVKLDFDEPLNESDPSYIAADKSAQYAGLDNKQVFEWTTQPTTQKDVYELETQRWPKVLAFRGIPNPIPAHLRPKSDDNQREGSAKKPMASEAVLISAMATSLNNTKQLDAFFSSVFGQPSATSGLAPHIDAFKSWSAQVATRPTTSSGVRLYNRQDLARERFNKRKQRVEQRQRQRKQRAKEAARLEAMERENVLVEEVPKTAQAENAKQQQQQQQQPQQGSAESAFANAFEEASETPSPNAADAGTNTPVEEEEEEVVVD